MSAADRLVILICSMQIWQWPISYIFIHVTFNLFVYLPLDTMDLVDPGLPDWKGNILKHLSAAQLNLARIDMEEKR